LIKVMIVDDHPVYRRGLELMLQDAHDIELVGVAENGQHAVELVSALTPDVVLMDLAMPDVDGYDATRRITEGSAHTKVLVLTMFEDDRALGAAIRAGAHGFLVKGADLDEITAAIRTAATGDAVFGRNLARRVLDHVSHSISTSPTNFPDLTDREREVLEHLAAGKANATIAHDLSISLKTVRNHVSNIFTKLRVNDRAAAIVTARNAGFGR